MNFLIKASFASELGFCCSLPTHTTTYTDNAAMYLTAGHMDEFLWCQQVFRLDDDLMVFSDLKNLWIV